MNGKLWISLKNDSCPTDRCGYLAICSDQARENAEKYASDTWNVDIFASSVDNLAAER